MRSSLLGVQDEQARMEYIQEHDLTGQDSVAVAQGRVYRGMPERHVLGALGSPDRINTNVYEHGASTQYVYVSMASAAQRGYVYVDEQGQVTGWQNLHLVPRIHGH
jgi:hypothetical protein